MDAQQASESNELANDETMERENVSAQEKAGCEDFRRIADAMSSLASSAARKLLRNFQA